MQVVEKVFDPEPVKACPAVWCWIGAEVAEQMDFETARFFKRRIVQRKYVRRERPFVAQILARLDTLQVRSITAPSLLAAVIGGIS